MKQDFLRYFPQRSCYPNQLEAMNTIHEALLKKQIILFEGACGTGKTLSSLAPALHIGKIKRKTVVIATDVCHERNQFIIESREIRKLADIKVIVLGDRMLMCPKPNMDYDICSAIREITFKLLEREKDFEQLKNEIRSVKDKLKRDKDPTLIQLQSELNTEFERVVKLLHETKKNSCGMLLKLCKSDTDDFREWLFASVRSPEEVAEWALTNNTCGYELLKRYMKEADLLICNYHNFLDEEMRENVLIWMDKSLSDVIIIVDDAHNIESAVRSHSSKTLTEYTLNRALDEIEANGDTSISDDAQTLLRVLLDTIRSTYNILLDKEFGKRERIGNDWYDLRIADPQERNDMFRAKLMAALEKAGITKLNETIEHLRSFGLKIDAFYEKQFDEGKSLIKKICSSLNTAIFLSDYFRFSNDKSYYPILNVKRQNSEILGRLELFTCIPKNVTAPLFNSVHSAILMSATLAPFETFKAALGITRDTHEMSFGLTFPKEKRLTIAVSVPALFSKDVDKPQIIDLITKVLMDIIEQTEGNVLIFFPSFWEATQYKNLLKCDIPIFLDEFGVSAQPTRDEFFRLGESGRKSVLISSLWGDLLEGVDYKHGRCRTVVIVGINPYPNDRTRAIESTYDSEFGNGSEYAIEIPTLRKVRQAMGRVVRSPEDYGVRVLLDGRYTSASVKKFDKNKYNIFPGYGWDEFGSVYNLFPEEERAEIVDVEPDRVKYSLMNFFNDMRKNAAKTDRTIEAAKFPFYSTTSQEFEEQTLKTQQESGQRMANQVEILQNSIGMKFTPIHTGEFMMGSNIDFEDEMPVHRVKINKPFYMGIYPVTQKEWKSVMGDNPSYFKGDDLPVEQVSWNDVQNFIMKLNQKEGMKKYRLPTEAEWEYAVRAGTTTRYFFGNDWSKLGYYEWPIDWLNGKRELILFYWPKDTENYFTTLIDYLMHTYGIEWVKAAKITINDDCKIIKITSNTNFLSLKLNDEKTNVVLEIDDGRTDKFMVKTEDDNLIIWRESKTNDVGKKKPNPWGLYDMYGNVWEWVQDKWHSDYNGAPIDGSSWESVDGSDLIIRDARWDHTYHSYASGVVGSDRVCRGGSWDPAAGRCRSALRYCHVPGYRSNCTGFRLLKEIITEEEGAENTEVEPDRVKYSLMNVSSDINKNATITDIKIEVADKYQQISSNQAVIVPSTRTAKQLNGSIIPSKGFIAEFITALDEEIKAIKAGNDGRSIKVFNGHLLGVTSGLFMYAFNLENFLVTIDDTPAEIEINSKTYKCQIVSVQGQTANEVVQVHEEIQRNYQQKLEAANRSGFIKRLFFGLNPNTIIHKIDQNSIIIDSKKRIVVDFKLRYDETKSNIIKKDGELVQLKKLVQEFSDQYSQYQLSQYGMESFQFTHSFRIKDTADKQRNDINSRIAEIDKSLDEIQTRVLSEARLVATTLTKTFTSKQFPDNPFDVLIVDESSMAPLPLLYWAASKVSLAITIIGDFNQLPPICLSEVTIAQKWLGHSIFDVLNITSVQKARQDGRVSLLDIQYRMNPSIANISNKLFYEGILKNDPSTEKHLLKDSLSGGAPLILIDTAQLNPWCSRLSTGGRFNISSALVSASIARKLSTDINYHKIGIVTPYRAHARMIGKIVKDWGISDRVRINTVHSFQGGEEEVMIFDCVEGPGGSAWSMLDDMRPKSDARLLLNVALTRAKCKLFLIVQTEYFLSMFKKDSAILKIIELFKKSGCKISAETVVDNYLGVDFEKVVNATTNQKDLFNGAESNLYTQKNFWQAFINDLQTAEKNVIIMSPFISLGRSGQLMDLFRVLIDKNVKMWIYTKPPLEQSDKLSEHAEQVIKQFEKLGSKVVQRKGMHQKIAIIDKKINWMGSLNILSHKNTQEQMIRFEGENVAKEIIRDMDLNEVEIDTLENISSKHCPKCLEEGVKIKMVAKKGKYGTFFGCSNFPICRHTENM